MSIEFDFNNIKNNFKYTNSEIYEFCKEANKNYHKFENEGIIVPSYGGSFSYELGNMRILLQILKDKLKKAEKKKEIKNLERDIREVIDYKNQIEDLCYYCARASGCMKSCVSYPYRE